MSNNFNKNQCDEGSFLEEGGIKGLEGKILTLSGNVLALRIELVSEHRKLMSYFKILSKQIYEIKNNLDYIRTYLDVEIEDVEIMNDEEWMPGLSRY